MRTSDVVIVGAGLAGLQCARLLGRQGLRVLLVDRKTSLEQSIHTTGIFVRRTIEDFDIPADCLGPPLQHVTLYSPSRRFSTGGKPKRLETVRTSPRPMALPHRNHQDPF